MRLRFGLISLLLAAGSVASPDTSAPLKDELAIKEVLAQFYAGWNAHDVDQMVSVYAEDVDHINTRAQWHQGKPAIREALDKAHSGPLKNDHKSYTVEKLRFVKPDVAVVQVRSISVVAHVGNIGTYVMSAHNGRWLVVSFTNVEYKLPSAGDTQ